MKIKQKNYKLIFVDILNSDVRFSTHSIERYNQRAAKFKSKEKFSTIRNIMYDLRLMNIRRKFKEVDEDGNNITLIITKNNIKFIFVESRNKKFMICKSFIRYGKHSKQLERIIENKKEALT